MDADALLEAIRREGTSLSSAARRGLDARVPGCPDWDIRELVRHVDIVYQHKLETLRRDAPPEGFDWYADPGDDPVSGMESSLATLLDAFERRGPQSQTWTWIESDQTVGFWIRRMAAETAIHRVDAEQAHGDADPVEAVLAADGVDEFMEAILIPSIDQKRTSVDGDAATIHLHATDADGEWLVVLDPPRISLQRMHEKGDAAIRGAASDLFTWIWGRPTAGTLESFGDDATIERFRKLAAQVSQ